MTIRSESTRGSEPTSEDLITTTIPGLLDLLQLEEIETDVFRAGTLFDDPMNLYGGQVAAQALFAVGQTVPEGRVPHSMHCYFLRAGDPMKVVDYFVHRDRDGRSYSSRTVSAMQEGREIFIMSASFHAEEEGPDAQAVQSPAKIGPQDPRASAKPNRTVDIEYRDPNHLPNARMAHEMWMRCTVDLGEDPLLHACVIAYVSDLFTGLFGLVPQRNGLALSSLDHAVWFLRHGRADSWLFMQLKGESLSHGRGLYSGDIFDEQGRLVAKLMQESLFRPRL
jgi:acyl-CoA thioesterase-2